LKSVLYGFRGNLVPVLTSGGYRSSRHQVYSAYAVNWQLPEYGPHKYPG